MNIGWRINNSKDPSPITGLLRVLYSAPGFVISTDYLLSSEGVKKDNGRGNWTSLFCLFAIISRGSSFVPFSWGVWLLSSLIITDIFHLQEYEAHNCPRLPCGLILRVFIYLFLCNYSSFWGNATYYHVNVTTPLGCEERRRYRSSGSEGRESQRRPGYLHLPRNARLIHSHSS